MARLDVTIATRKLDESDRRVLFDHYVRGVPQPGYARRRAIRQLRVVLDTAYGPDDD